MTSALLPLTERLQPERCLPDDHDRAVLIGRIWQPSVDGPTPVLVRSGFAYDLSAVAPTVSQLLNLEHPIEAIRSAEPLPLFGSSREMLANSAYDARTALKPWFIAPCDLQAIKAAGVTFVASLLERIIEEHARGNAAEASALRETVTAVIGADLSRVSPGSPDSARIKELLTSKGLWSQYLEVGIGPDAEIFTKSQPMSAVGIGAEVGLHPRSEWNNPEPEIVLAVSNTGRVMGATLGNDVNLRDFEGRSALLLGKAKDNNASCAIGPLIRLFDTHYTIDHVRASEVALQIEGPDGFRYDDHSSMKLISRDPVELVRHAMGANHQYPDGAMLFLGTMFAPTKDRSEHGKGFTHMVGDIVTVSTPTLGSLINRVNLSDKVAPWTFGATALMGNLASRGLL